MSARARLVRRRPLSRIVCAHSSLPPRPGVGRCCATFPRTRSACFPQFLQRLLTSPASVSLRQLCAYNTQIVVAPRKKAESLGKTVFFLRICPGPTFFSRSYGAKGKNIHFCPSPFLQGWIFLRTQVSVHPALSGLLTSLFRSGFRHAPPRRLPPTSLSIYGW